MNLDFTYYLPTKIYFGRNALENIRMELPKYGPTVLLVYGRNSIKKNGIYDEIMKYMKEAGKKVVELSGVMANPTSDKMKEGIELAREHDVDLIVAAGGGSVMDCAKGIAAGAKAEGDVFTRFWVNQEDVDNETIPLAAVVTMAGTGSEMNTGSVITDTATKQKIGRVFDERMAPRFSILNPEYTLTLPLYQMKSGICDTFSHLMEQYFSDSEVTTSDYMNEGLMRALIDYTGKATAHPEEYEVRSNLMWLSTMAPNGTMGLSKTQDWNVHAIEHQVGAYTDCTHGMGLAAISPTYYRHIYKEGLPRFVSFARNVWGIHDPFLSDEETALAGIDALEDFLKKYDMYPSLRELGVTEDMIDEIAASVTLYGGYKKLTHKEIAEILREAM